jgi:hypothetical protein
MTAPRSLEELAVDPSVSTDLQMDLLRRGDVAIRVALAGRSWLAPEVAQRLAKDRSVKVRSALAARAPREAELIARLAADSSAVVRRTLLGALSAAFGGIPGRRSELRAAQAVATEQLAGDDDPGIRVACARLTALPERGHSVLAADPAPDVRASLAGNLAVATALLDRLAADPEPAVAAAALRNPFVSTALVRSAATDDAAWKRAAAAANVMLPRDEAIALLGDPEDRVVAVVAGNPRVPLAAVAERLDGLPENPPSHRGAKMPYAPVGSLRDHVEHRLARACVQGATCQCGGVLQTKPFDWEGATHDDREDSRFGPRFLKLWCQGCGRGWSLDLSVRAQSDHAVEIEPPAESVPTAEVPARYAALLEPFAAVVRDEAARLPVAWGFPIAPWVPKDVVDHLHDELDVLYLGVERDRDHTMWCARSAVVTRRLTRADAAELYGAFAGDDFEQPQYGALRWRSARFGDHDFSADTLKPTDDELPDAERAWYDRQRAERDAEDVARAARMAAFDREQGQRRAQEQAQGAECLELLGGPQTPPAAFADCLGPFRAVGFDGYCGQPVDWGFPVTRRVGEERWAMLGREGDLQYIGDRWALVVLSLTPEIARTVYGPVTHEERGPRGGWRWAQYGETRFMSRRLDPR